MKLQEYIDNIKLELTGGVLELEIDDNTLGKFVKRALEEVQRYIDVTKMVTVPFAPCIDLGPWTDEQGVEHPGFNSSAVVHVYRTEGYTGDTSGASGASGSAVDPMYAQAWMTFSAGPSMYNLNAYLLNYMSYNTLLQMRNTTSTDMAFREDKDAKKLYINTGYDRPAKVTIEYVPVYLDCEDITSDYWIDILQRLSIAMVKVALGRIRTRFKVSNNPYTDDGDTILAEGQNEINNIREILRTNSTLFYPID